MTGVLDAAQAASQIADEGFAMGKAEEDDVIEAHETDDLSKSPPTEDNRTGGLTPVEGRALGNIETIGHDRRCIDMPRPAESPGRPVGPEDSARMRQGAILIDATRAEAWKAEPCRR